MEEEVLNKVGEFLVKLIQAEMGKPRARFTKTGAQKIPPRYNFVGTGALRNSVEYFIRDGEIDIVMLDYGVDYVFSDLAQSARGTEGGSQPSYPPSSQTAINSLRKWVEAKLKIPPAKSKGVAFAIGKRLNKVGYKGLPLFTKESEEEVYSFVENLLQDPRYEEVFLEDIFDRLNFFGKQTYTIAIS